MNHRIPFAILLLVFLPGIVSSFWEALNLFLGSFSALLPFVIGAIIGAVFDLVLVIRKISALNNLIHDCGHAFTALLFFKRIDKFVLAEYRGGEVYYSGGFGGALVSDVIGLAPYSIPAIYCVLVLARASVDEHFFPHDLVVGFYFGLYTIVSPREIWLDWTRSTFVGAWSGVERKTDLADRGFVFSFIYIVTVTLAIHGLLLSVLAIGYPGILSWANVVWDVTKNEMIPITNGLVTAISDQVRSFLR